MWGRFGQGGPKGAVCILYGLDADHFNCQRVFNLFCQYGNIRKIMFLKSKEGTAMMEMDDPGQVESILENMMHAEMFGLKVRADWSKKDCITNVINPYKLKDGSESYQSFEGDRNNRFSTPERAAKNRILPPSKYLHFYNVPKLTDSEMENVFSDAGAPTPTSIKWLNHAESKFVSGILAFDSVGEACEALCLLNHHGFKGDSKYPQVMKLCFSMGPRDREREERGGGGGRGGRGGRRNY
jgi:heterogeneous nuclear ribonucleoprotein L